MKIRIKIIFAVTIVILPTIVGLCPPDSNAQIEVSGRNTRLNDLVTGFLSPPNSAKPRAWWHWTNGNVTREGITKDMEWMKRVGIGGMQLFDVSSGSGQNVNKRIIFMTTEWLEMLEHAASEADRLGLEMTIHSSARWNLVSGPWVKPEQAMKKLVWSEIYVEGPRKLKEMLPQPPSENEPIRNRSNLRFAGIREAQDVPPDSTYYDDVVVLAYRTLEKEVRMVELNPKVTSISGAIDATLLLDNDLTTGMALSIPEEGKPAWIQFEFDQPFRARAFSISVEAGMRGIPTGLVQASDDGINYRTLVALPGAQHDRSPFPVRTYAFPETTARYYRIELKSYPTNLLFGRRRKWLKRRTPAPLKQHDITDLVFHSGARINRWEDKAGFTLMFEYESVPTPMVPDAAIIQQNDVTNLTARLAKDGTLEWDVPTGNWTILRLGYSLTGSRNGPAVPEGTGYEVDKLSRKHVEAYYHGYVDPIAKELGTLFGESLRYFLMDSYEAGHQNWTDDMISEFRNRRGYDPTPYLPVLTGHVMGSAEVSDRFLWDFRRTIADLLAENHYGVFADLAHQKGLGIYSEAAGVSAPAMEDGLQNKRFVDIPMGEFWLGADMFANCYYSDNREAASAAHIYGKKIVPKGSGGRFERTFSCKRKNC